jgi:hypothetical protein
MPADEHPDSAHVRCISIQFGGRSNVAAGAASAVANSSDRLPKTGVQMWSSSSRYVRSLPQLPSASLSFLETGSDGHSNRRHASILTTSGSPVHLSTFEASTDVLNKLRRE